MTTTTKHKLAILALSVINIALILMLVIAGIQRRNHICKSEIIISNEYQALDEWQIMMMAIAEEESGYDSNARSERNARGLMQLTPIYVSEYNRITGQSLMEHDAYNDESALAMFATLQAYYNPEHDIDKAIRLHNPTAGKWYTKRIKMRMGIIRRMEQVREMIINY